MTSTWYYVPYRWPPPDFLQMTYIWPSVPYRWPLPDHLCPTDDLHLTFGAVQMTSILFLPMTFTCPCMTYVSPYVHYIWPSVSHRSLRHLTFNSTAVIRPILCIQLICHVVSIQFILCCFRDLYLTFRWPCTLWKLFFSFHFWSAGVVKYMLYSAQLNNIGLKIW